jgi:hypothetical protein
MALLEEPNVCALCGRPVSGYVDGVPVYLCPHCYKVWGPEFVTKVAWAVFLLNEEKARRKRRNRVLAKGGLPTFQHTYQGIAL